MMELTLGAPAKVNLSLRIVGRKANGYHELDMLMAPTDLCDTVKIRITKHGGADIRVTCSDQRMQGSNNIAYKAAAAILQYTGRLISGTDININIEKSIPVGAGLGGGSADAAAVIVGLNKLLDLKLSKGQLIEIGHGIGSDVPFCIEAVLNENNESSCDSGSSVADKGFVARVGGTGEQIHDISMKKFKALFVNPGFEVNTGSVYKKYDELGLVGSSSDVVDKMEKALANNEIFSLDEYFINDLTTPAFHAYPRLEEARDEIIAAMKKSFISSTSNIGTRDEAITAGCKTNTEGFVHMVGSGATFMIFLNENIEKERALCSIKETLSGCDDYNFKVVPATVG